MDLNAGVREPQWSEGLRGVHREIAAEPHSPVHVLAGPGTGKTFAMMRRIARLLSEGATPERILAVSFTRTAARDLAEQLQNLNVEGSERVRVMTLHSLSYSFLAQQQVFELTGRTPRPLLSYEEKQLVNDLASLFGGKKNVRAMLRAYEASWARLQKDAPDGPANPDDDAFEAALLKWLRFYNCMLIGELVPLTLTFLRQNPALSELLAFDHVLVDEYQDLNRADQELVQELAKGGTLTVIGDDNQSIYSFRFANPDAIQSFPTEHPDTATFVIEECRRCPPNIVEMSNALIRQNPARARDVPLRPMEGRSDAQVFIVQHPMLTEEINALADFVGKYRAGHPQLPGGQILVLATRRFIGHRIRTALIHRGFNALSYFFEDELEEQTAAEGFALLNLLASPTDAAAWRGWIGLGQPSAGFAAGVARIRDYAEREHLTFQQLLERLANGEVHIPYAATVVARFRKAQEELERLRPLLGLELVRGLWRPDDVNSLDIRLQAEALAMELPQAAGLFDALLREITQPQLPDSDSDIIRVMSLHKSKGLTASLVIVAGCMAGAIPSYRLDDDVRQQQAQIQEQRRLFYVAITRATDTLILSSSVDLPLRDAMAGGVTIRSQRWLGGEAVARVAASPFLGELGRSAPATITTAQWRTANEF